MNLDEFVDDFIDRITAHLHGGKRFPRKQAKMEMKSFISRQRAEAYNEGHIAGTAGKRSK